MLEGLKIQDGSGFTIQETQYNYDDLNQLTKVEYYDSPYYYQTHSYGYDAVGNKMSENVTKTVGAGTIFLYKENYAYG